VAMNFVSNHSRLNRRQFLTAAAAAGATAAFSGRDLLTGAPQAQPRNTRPIDVHYHLWSPEFMGIGKENGFKVNPGTPIFWDPKHTPWNLSKAVEDNDKWGIMGMTSVPGTTNWGPKPELWKRMARVSNEYAAKIRSDYPKLFGMWATLPMRDIDGTLKEIEYAMDTLKADGFGLITNYFVNGTDKFQGDEMFNPIYEELNRRKAVIYVHPSNLKCQQGATQVCEEVLPKGVGDESYLIDTGRAMGTLIFTGSTTRYPDITWIFSHSGGTGPVIYFRSLIHRKAPTPTTPNYKGTAAEFKKFYYDTAQTYDPDEMRLAKSLWSVQHMVFGSDYPYFSSAETAEGVKNCGIFNPAELRAIYYENVQRLVPRLRTISS